MYREDPEYGRIVDFDWLRTIHRQVADNFHPRFNMLGAVRTCIELTTSEPSVNIAIGAGADPALFALTVAIATSNSFLIPTHQVNALIMGPAGYRVVDFLRAGGIMTVLFLGVSLVMLNIAI